MTSLEKTVENGYCPKCDKRTVMATIKKDGSAYQFCKSCGWTDKTESLEKALKQNAKTVDSKTIQKLCTHPSKKNCKVAWCLNEEVCNRNNKAILLNDAQRLVGERATKIREIFDEREYHIYTHEDFVNFKKEVLAVLVEAKK